MNISKDLDSLQNACPSKLYRDTACTCICRDHNMFVRVFIVTDDYIYIPKKLFQVIQEFQPGFLVIVF